jgi:hypothetical protein
VNAERLLNVAKALRESPNPDKFAMYSYGHCDTPMCAFGHYAYRTDLQTAFLLTESGPELRDGECVSHDDQVVLDHFEFSSEDEANQFFGCHVAARHARERGLTGPFLVDEAKTANEAADWIERFVAEHTEVQP